jgi:hypothetical protein
MIDESFTGTTSQPGADGSDELGVELTSMRALVRTLEQLPGQAWASELGSATQPTRSAAALRAAGLPSRRPAPLGRPTLPGLERRLRIAPRVGGPLAAAVLAIAFFVGALTHPFAGATGRPRVLPLSGKAHVVLKPLPGTSTGGLAVAYMPGGGHMILNVRNLPPSAPGSYYELWLMTSDTDLVSVTSFRVGASGTGSLRLVLPDDPSHYRYLDISVQHLGGGIAISQDNVLRGVIPA